MNPESLWHFLPVGYLATVAIELPILLLGLSPRYSLKTRLLAGLWLTACTYPIVVLVLPLALPATVSRWGYLVLAEVFAPLAECLLFWLAFARDSTDRRAFWRDMLTIIAANLASFAVGEMLL